MPVRNERSAPPCFAGVTPAGVFAALGWGWGEGEGEGEAEAEGEGGGEG